MFFSCFPSCLPKKNAHGTRLSCGCVTGAVPASKQAANTHTKKKTKKEIKTRPNFGEHCYSSLLSAVILHRPRRPSLDLQNGTRSAVRCPPHSFVSPNNQRRSGWHSAALRGASRSWLMLSQLDAIGRFGSNFYFQEFTQLGNRIPANVRDCVSSKEKKMYWNPADDASGTAVVINAPRNPAEVYFNFPHKFALGSREAFSSASLPAVLCVVSTDSNSPPDFSWIFCFFFQTIKRWQVKLLETR